MLEDPSCKRAFSAVSRVIYGRFFYSDDASAAKDILARQGVSINMVGRDGSLLHEAAQMGAAKVCKLLLDCGANASLRDKEGLTPLHRVVSQRKEPWPGREILGLLLARGADMGADSLRCGTPLIEAIRLSNVEAVAMLLAAGAPLTKQGRSDAVPLHSATTGSAKFSRPICELLLDAGTDISALDRSGWTALHRAAFFGRQPICELLIERGADAKALACSVKKSVTPFQMAVSQDHVELVKWFMNTVGEDPTQKTLSGRALAATAKTGSATKAMLMSLKSERAITSKFDEEQGSAQAVPPKRRASQPSPI
jgi:ankyrin repeat protein